MAFGMAEPLPNKCDHFSVLRHITWGDILMLMIITVNVLRFIVGSLRIQRDRERMKEIERERKREWDRERERENEIERENEREREREREREWDRERERERERMRARVAIQTFISAACCTMFIVSWGEFTVHVLYSYTVVPLQHVLYSIYIL